MIGEAEVQEEVEEQIDPYLAIFTEVLELVTVFEGTAKAWSLPAIDSGLDSQVAEVSVAIDFQLANVLTYKKETFTFTYDGKSIGGVTDSKLFTTDIVLSNPVGDNSYKMTVLFYADPEKEASQEL